MNQADHYPTTVLKPMNPTRLAAMGEALFGSHWQHSVARLLNVNPRSVREWASGQEDIPLGIGDELSEAIRGNLRRGLDILPILVPQRTAYKIDASILQDSISNEIILQNNNFIDIEEANIWLNLRIQEIKGIHPEAHSEITITLNDYRVKSEYTTRAWSLIYAANTGHSLIRWRSHREAEAQGAAMIYRENTNTSNWELLDPAEALEDAGSDNFISGLGLDPKFAHYLGSNPNVINYFKSGRIK